MEESIAAIAARNRDSPPPPSETAASSGHLRARSRICAGPRSGVYAGGVHSVIPRVWRGPCDACQ